MEFETTSHPCIVGKYLWVTIMLHLNNEYMVSYCIYYKFVWINIIH
jgi:hypothetical protein